MQRCVLFPQELSNGGVVFINAGRSGAERMSATAALKHRFMAQARPLPFTCRWQHHWLLSVQAVLEVLVVTG